MILSIRCILGDIRLWVGGPSTHFCLLSLPRGTQGSQPTLSLSGPYTGGAISDAPRTRFQAEQYLTLLELDLDMERAYAYIMYELVTPKPETTNTKQ